MRDESLTTTNSQVYLLVVSSTPLEFLRFIPDPDFYGSASIYFVPWDQTGIH